VWLRVRVCEREGQWVSLCVLVCAYYGVFVLWCECVRVSENQCAQKSRKARARNLR